jgi:sugar phosphate isomerase/epimerase
MVEFCLETVNWSPYLGYERPDLGRIIRAASGAGFGWIAFDLPCIDYFIAHDGPIDLLRANLDAHGLKMLAVHSLSISNDVDAVEAMARSAVAIGRVLGARYLHGGVISPVDDRVIEATRRAQALCRQAGLGLAIEFLPFLPVASIAQTRALLDAAGVGGRNLVVDSWHFFNGPDDWPALEGLRGDEIAYVQFNDHGPLASDDLLEETIHHRVMPGEGIFALDRFARVIQASGFDGIVGVEVMSHATRQQPIDVFAKRAMDSSRPYWANKV